MMHPIERLRHVARADGSGPGLLAREAAGALASIGDDPAGLVTGCRRLVERHPAVGPMWWLAARVLVAGDPVAEAWRAARELHDDPTPNVVGAHLPHEATVVVVGWPEQASESFQRRGDLQVLVVEAPGQGRGLSRRLRAAGATALDVAGPGLGPAVAEAGMVLLEASALGPTGFVAPTGARAAAAVARHAGVPVWVVAGVGRVLPSLLWDALCRCLEADDEDPWDRREEIVPLDLAEEVVGPSGRQPVAEVASRADCPVAPELLRPIH
jgi:hypothetical protein